MSQWIMVTLDSGTEALVRDEMHRTGLPMNEAINELLRAGSRARRDLAPPAAASPGLLASRRADFDLEPGLMADASAPLFARERGSSGAAPTR